MKIGNYELHQIETGRFSLDGGSMFGVVPKVLWNELIPADDENRIEMACRALLIVGDKRKILVDTGFGNKFSEKQKSIYKIDNSKYDLISSLKKFDLETKDITDVILTHLHFDHAGGATYLEAGKRKLTFPNAVYYVQKTHYEWALEPSLKDKSGFNKDDFKPVVDEGKMRLVEGQVMILPDIQFITSDGHTTGLQLVKIFDLENTLLFCSDLIPTAHHIRLPYIAAYDNYPITIVKEKKEILTRAYNNNWILFFQHDPGTEAARVGKDDKGFVVKEKVVI